MCGIVGQINFNNQKVREVNIEKMMKAIAHRGPDDSGLFVTGHVGVGFCRLSIMDTEGGHQPIYNESNSVIIVANGEIYNYPDLKKSMKSKGHIFRTGSDVEVILHLYEEYGLQFIEHLNGMFAFCLYDIQNDLMVLGRDRMGIKPLYILERPDGLFFGSEIKGIISSDQVETTKEGSVLEEYLIFRFLSNNRTFFKGIKSLDPGTLLVIDHGKLRTKCYYSLQEMFIDKKESECLTETLYDKLSRSVDRQLMSDVPLGTLLSGGIDSGFVTGLASRKYQNLKSFTVGFLEKEYNESEYAKIVSEKFNTEYHEIKVDNREFSDTLPKAIWYHDEPLNHANSVQIYLISKYAKKFVKVLLTGEGADELWGGYPRYQIHKLGVYLGFFGEQAKYLLIYPLGRFKNRKIKKMAELLNYSPEDRVIMNSAFIQNTTISNLLLDWNTAVSNRRKVFQNVVHNTDDPLNQLLFFEQRTYLQSVLSRADKMSMAASIEARVPFLDNEMVTFSNSIAGKRKLRGLTTKFLLKESSRKILPTEIVNKKKVGFANPIAPWLRDPKGLGRYLDQILDDGDIIGKVSKKTLERLVSDHKSSNQDHSEILWPLINYSIWHQQFF